MADRTELDYEIIQLDTEIDQLEKEIIKLKFESVKGMFCEDCDWDMTDQNLPYRDSTWDNLRISDNWEKVWCGNCVSWNCNRWWCGSPSEDINTKRIHKGKALCHSCFKKK